MKRIKHIGKKILIITCLLGWISTIHAQPTVNAEKEKPAQRKAEAMQEN